MFPISGRAVVGLSCLAIVTFAQAQWPALSVKPAEAWPQFPAGWNFVEPAGVGADSRGHVYVIHRGDHPIMEFDPDGRFVQAFGDGLFDRAHAIRVDREGYIWAVDDGSHVVLKMDRKGRVLMVLGRRRRSSEVTSSIQVDPSIPESIRGIRDDTVPRFNRPTDIAVSPGGDLFVSDGYGNSRIVKFSKDGQFLKAWGRKGNAPGEFNIPHAIALDQKGRVYVADRENYRIQIFDSDGNFIKQWKHVGSPWGLDITPEQHILMADGYNSRILKLDLEGRVLGMFGTFGKRPGQVSYVHHLAVDPRGAIYTAEILSWRVQKFVPEP